MSDITDADSDRDRNTPDRHTQTETEKTKRGKRGFQVCVLFFLSNPPQRHVTAGRRATFKPELMPYFFTYVGKSKRRAAIVKVIEKVERKRRAEII